MSQLVERKELQPAPVLSRDCLEGMPRPPRCSSIPRPLPRAYLPHVHTRVQVPLKKLHEKELQGKVDGPLECTICEAIVKIVDGEIENNATEVRGWEACQ